jgi:hypothetical protein
MRYWIFGIAVCLLNLASCKSPATGPKEPPPETGHAGSIMIENGSYQSCLLPMVVTVVDTDLAGATVPIRVKSTTDPTGFVLLLKSVTGAPYTYSDSVFFSIVTTDSASRRIRIRDGDFVKVLYNEALPARVDSLSTLWTGQTGTLDPGASIYTGVLNKLSISLFDQDVTDPTVTIRVKSDKDTAGIMVPLHALGSGSFTGRIWFSLTGSVADSVLAVMGTADDNVWMFYHDLTPDQIVRSSICTWKPSLATIVLDASAYHGTDSTAAITLYDDDIIDSTVIVKVTSTTDATGISDTLRVGTPGKFTGHVGFSTGASSAGIIAVQDNDSVTVSYQDGSPDSLVTQSASWKSGYAGSIMIENGSYQSCLAPMVVTVVDTDLVGATVPIRVKSTTDPTGFVLLLKSVAGSPGTYSDSVFFSIVTTDSASRRIRVLDYDNVTVLYAEASPARVDSISTMWSGQTGTLDPGASIYTGVLNKLSISLFDQDVTDLS